jgi:hypothetical protein
MTIDERIEWLEHITAAHLERANASGQSALPYRRKFAVTTNSRHDRCTQTWDSGFALTCLDQLWVADIALFGFKWSLLSGHSGCVPAVATGLALNRTLEEN